MIQQPAKPMVCPACKVRLRIRTSKRLSSEVQEQRLECKFCDYKTKRQVHANEVWRRGQ